MRSCIAFFIALAALVCTRSALAQPGADAERSDLDAPPVVEAVEPIAPAPLPAPLPSATDSSELIALFDHAFEALLRRDFVTAAEEFRAVAERSVEIDRRAAAAELARQATKRFGIGDRTARAGILRSSDENDDLETGRATFLSIAVIAGLNYGWFVPVILDVDDAKSFVGLYLVSASASFAVPYLLTRDEHITRGMSTLGGSGILLGLGHGALLYGAVAGENGFENGRDLRLLLTSMLAGSIAEGTAGYLWARNQHLSAGHAGLLSSSSIWGLGYAAGANILIAGEDIEFRSLLASMLIGSVAGTIGGNYYYGSGLNLSEGDAALVSYTGALGAYAGLSSVIVGEVDNPRVVAGVVMAGATLGLLAGDHVARSADYSRSEAGVVTLGSLAGGLLGAGAAFLITPDDAEIGKWIVTGGVSGAIGGLFVMLKAVDPDPEGSRAEEGPIAELTPIVGPNGEAGLGLVGRF